MDARREKDSRRPDGREAAGELRRAPRPEPATESSQAKKSPGRVVFDSRGNPTWEWAEAEGESTSILLKRLDNDALELEPTRSAPKLGGKPGGAAGQKNTHRTGRTGRIGSRVDCTGRADRTGRAGRAEPHELTTDESYGGFDPYNRS